MIEGGNLDICVGDNVRSLDCSEYEKIEGCVSKISMNDGALNHIKLVIEQINGDVETYYLYNDSGTRIWFEAIPSIPDSAPELNISEILC